MPKKKESKPLSEQALDLSAAPTSSPDSADSATPKEPETVISPDAANQLADEAEGVLLLDPPAPMTESVSELIPDEPPVEDAPTFSAPEPNADTAAPEGDGSPAKDTAADAPQESTPAPTAAPKPRRRTTRQAAKKPNATILTIDAHDEVESEAAREETAWHEIHNAYRTRKILTGQLSGIEQTPAGQTIAIVDYNMFRVVIPLKEMMITLYNTTGQSIAYQTLRQCKLLGKMLGADIDFVVKGIDSKTRSVVASRREAMMQKRQIFYNALDANGQHRVHVGRIVQARVVAVAEKAIRVEIFGVECSIMAHDLAWEWIGDAQERFSVGDTILVRILEVNDKDTESIIVRADIKSLSSNTNVDNLEKCQVQAKYAGQVIDVHKGIIYVRLSNGVNAIAHSCYDYRTPGKKDDVSFVVTRLDKEHGVAVGIIARIIRQNL